MADKAEKPKKSKAKPKKDEQGVLAALPSTRPQRIGGRRATAPKTFEKRAAATGGRAKRAAPATKPAATRATASRRKAAAPRTFEPTLAAESAAGASDERAAGAAEERAAAERVAGAAGGSTAATQSRPQPAPEPRPRAVREGAPGMGTSGARERTAARDDAESPEHGRPSGVELVTTAVQAAGELTQIGLTIGGQIVKRAVERLPKP